MNEALELLRLQVEWGADEAIEDAPPDRTRRSARAAGSRPSVSAPAIGGAAIGVAGRAEQAAGAATDLAALAAAFAGFEGLELRHTAGQFVFGDGPADAAVMFAVEAPSAEDDETGTPLSGTQGRLFEAMLRSIGLARGEVRVGCLVPWRPPGGRPPSPVEVGACAPFLRAHLRLLPSVQLVAMMGGTVAKTLGGAEGRGWRGRWFDIPVEGRGAVPGLAMAPPETIGTEARAKALAWADLLSLKRRMDAVSITRA